MIAIFATGIEFEFGNDNKLPWISCPTDLKRFKEVTDNKILLMGAETFKSLPSLLKGRTHVVLSNNTLINCKDGSRPHYIFSGDFKRCIEEIKLSVGTDIAVIGGPSVISQSIDYGEIRTLYISTIGPFEKELDCDVRFDYRSLLKNYRLIDKNTSQVKIHTQVTPTTLTERIYEAIS